MKLTSPNPHPNPCFLRLCPNQHRARHQTTRSSPCTLTPLKLFKPATPKSTYPASPLPSHGCPGSPLPNRPCSFPTWSCTARPHLLGTVTNYLSVAVVSLSAGLTKWNVIRVKNNTFRATASHASVSPSTVFPYPIC